MTQPLTEGTPLNIFRPPARAYRRATGDNDESPQFAAFAQEARQGLPYHPA